MALNHSDDVRTSAPRTAVVTGAGTGIGRACAIALAAAGWQVVACGRRREPLEAVVGEIDAVHGAGRALAVPTDVTVPAQVEALFDATTARFGRVDLLFNNAGLMQGGRFEDLSVDTWRAMVDTNLTGPFLCAQAAYRRMMSQSPKGGRIVNNGSISAHAPRPDSAPYTATKHAISGLTKSISLDGRAHDIACGQLDIGNAATELASKIGQGVKQADGRLAAEPMIDPALVAEALVYMASLPLHANVHSMTVMATKMPFVGRG